MKKNISIFISFILFTALLPLSGYTWPIPDSGQTKCYDGLGNELNPCPSPGEDFYGQDGNYLINPPSYTKLDAAGNDLPDGAASWVMVRDNVTGLIWEGKQNKDGVKNYADPHDADNTYTWYDSNPETNGGYAGTPGDGTDTEDFIKQLNMANFGGYSDWRLPTIKELASVQNLATCVPTIDTIYFPNTLVQIGESNYWSSSTHASDMDGARARYSDFTFGYGASYGPKSNSRYVIAVRSFQAQTSGYFIINNDGTVTDTYTGLMWQQATGGEMTWENAISHCEDLSLAGYSDWRLPNREELRSVVDYERYDPTIDTEIFSDTFSSNYWSASYDCGKSSVRTVDFDDGFDFGHSKSDIDYVRAVRGGQPQISGHLIITSPSQASFWESGHVMPIRWKTENTTGNVKITLSRDGGKTFENITDSTPNDGVYDWTVSYPPSVNCMLKIEPLSDPDKWTQQSFFTIIPDTTPPTAPTLQSTVPPAQTWTNDNTFSISWNPGEDSESGVAGYSYIFDTSPATDPDSTVDTDQNQITGSPLSDGSSHYFHIRTVDNAGNVSTTLHIGPFKIDTVNPAAPTFKSSDIPAQTWTNSSSISVSWNPGLDSGSGVAGYSCIFDTSPFTDPDSTVDTTGTQITGSSLSDGTNHYFHVRTVDNAGNVSSTIHVGPFYIDTSEPYGTITINGGASSGSSQNVILSLWAGDTGSGVSQMAFSNDSVNWSEPEIYAVSKNWTLAPGEGIKTVYARFSDNAGNRISGNYPYDTIMFEIPDTIPPTAPTFQNSSPLAQTWTNDNTVTVSWNAGTDSKSGVAGYSCIFDTNPTTNPDSTVETAAAQVTGSPLSDGSAHYFHVRTVDNAGNTSSTLHVGPFQIDTTPPLGMMSINNGSVSALSPDVTLSLSANDSASGLSQMCFSNDSINWSSAENYAPSKTWTLSSGEGSKRVYARFSDIAGNWTTAAVYDDILREPPQPPTAPSLKTASPYVNTWSNDNTVTISWYPGTSQDSGIAGYSLVMDRSPFTDVDNTVETAETAFTSAPLADGKNHYFHIRTVDDRGNVSEITNLGPFYIDTAPPEGTGIVINNGEASTSSADVKLSLAGADSGSGMAKMQFSNDSVYWSVSRDYATAADWILLSGKGTRTVYARFSDVAGNWTESSISDEIYISTRAFGRLILIAGGGAEKSNTLWPVTKELVTSVYRNFSLRGFTDEDIWFMSPQDIDYNGDGFYDRVVDSPPLNENRNITLSDVEYAVKNWAADAHIPGIPLYIWLIDHGYPDDGTHGPWFVISPGQALYADALDSMTDTYESLADNSRVIVVNESCYSGQFLSPLKKPERIVITASDSKTVNYSNLGANSFTNLFLQMLFENNTLLTGFGKAADYLTRDRLTENQHPQLDDNGDGKYDQYDGMLAASMKLGSDFAMGAPWPRIFSAERKDISENQIAFAVSVNAHMKRVWATVQPPGYVPDMSGDYQYIDLETFDFSDSDDNMVYDGTYADFSRNGTYIVRFYARDQFGNTAVAEAMEIMIGTAEPGDVNGDGSVNLADAVLALKICADIPVSGTEINTDAAVGSNSVIGIQEAVYVLRKAAGF